MSHCKMQINTGDCTFLWWNTKENILNDVVNICDFQQIVNIL